MEAGWRLTHIGQAASCCSVGVTTVASPGQEVRILGETEVETNNAVV